VRLIFRLGEKAWSPIRSTRQASISELAAANCTRPGMGQELEETRGWVAPDSGATLREALEALFQAHPGLRDRILAERGEVRTHINLFFGNADMRSTGGLATPIPRGIPVSIMPAISGG
jgi:sulfur-carrier protein